MLGIQPSSFLCHNMPDPESPSLADLEAVVRAPVLRDLETMIAQSPKDSYMAEKGYLTWVFPYCSAHHHAPAFASPQRTLPWPLAGTRRLSLIWPAKTHSP